MVDRLKQETISNLDLYLPQICYLVLTKAEPKCVRLLERFILEISIKHANIGFRALHYFQSWSEDSPFIENSYVYRADDFYNLLEGALVN